MTENIFQEVTGQESIPDWARDVGVSARSLIEDEHETIIEYMDFNRQDLPPYHKATVLHTGENPSSTDTPVIRLEFRIGNRGPSGWEIPDEYSISALENSKYFRYYHHRNGDSTYVDFFFDLPPKLQKYVEEFEREMES